MTIAVGRLRCRTIQPILVFLVVFATTVVAKPGSKQPGFLATVSPFQRSKVPLRGLALVQQPNVSTAGTTIVKPQPNDTIPQEYYTMIDAAIAAAEAATPPPTPAISVTESPLEKVLGASVPAPVSAEDLTPEEVHQAVLVNPVLAPDGEWTKAAKNKVSLVPYDMQLGAQILDSLSQQATSTPPPAQEIVDQQFVAQCPMIMFKNSMTISAPRCGHPFGEWADPATSRSILRWQPAERGGLYFGVDSVVDGYGSVAYATFQQEFALNNIAFRLLNCMRISRYTIEEMIMKVDHIGHGITSSIQPHDVSRTVQAFFYKYTIRRPNGSAVAETSLYRMNQNQINVTLYKGDVADGELLATATKQGNWKQEDWRQCNSGTKRAWSLEFVLEENQFETVATVADLRVATAAMITLMAYRDESINQKTGVTREGEKSMMSQLLLGVFLFIVAALLILIIMVVGKKKGVDAKMRRLCFKFEAALLPKRPAHPRDPPIPTTY